MEDFKEARPSIENKMTNIFIMSVAAHTGPPEFQAKCCHSTDRGNGCEFPCLAQKIFPIKDVPDKMASMLTKFLTPYSPTNYYSSSTILQASSVSF